MGGFLTEDFEDGVVLEVMDDLGRVQGSCPEGFVELSLFLAEILKIVVLAKKSVGHTDRRQTLLKFNIDIKFLQCLYHF